MCRDVRRKCAALLAVALVMAPAPANQSQVVAVVTLGEVEAFQQAVQGIREKFPGAPVWDARDEARLKENFSRMTPSLAIAVGSTAAQSVGRAAPSQTAVVGSVVLASDLDTDTGKRWKTAVTIDLPPEVLLAQLARLFPGKNRLAVIRGPLQSAAYMRELEQAARRHGFTMVTAPCQQAKDLVETFLKLRSQADLVWCPPNPQLYNSATVKPLLVASLTSRLPVIGFSEQFVQAGALFGGSADFAEVGRQTAALAARVSRNEPVPPHEDARKFRFAYNQRVARLLGVKASLPAESDELVVLR
jgi:ABC-type uncharacterized transport system substrate-binding protein